MPKSHLTTASLPRVNGHVVPSDVRRRVEIAQEPAPAARRVMDIVQEWGVQSFPASDPPANW